jgi:hypothetical protein
VLGADPVGDGLGEGRFGKGVAAGAKSGDKDLDRMDLAGGAVDEGQGHSGVVDKELLARLVGLAHPWVESAFEVGEGLAELAVAEALRGGSPILFPEQAQRDAFALEFGVEVLPVGQRSGVRRAVYGRWKKALFELFFGEALG